MHRFFVPPEWIGATHVTLQDAVAHQIRNVLRMHPGDHVVVLDNAGWEYTVTLEDTAAKTITATIADKSPARGEPPVALTLFQALLKKDNFEWVLQKCTEIGVTRFVPLETQRTIVPPDSINAKKRERWERILTEAAEQSRRGRIPELAAPLTFSAALAQRDQFDLVLIPWEDEHALTLGDAFAAHRAPERLAIIIGPEGGFSPDEIEQARTHNALPVTLGPRILRAETAAIAATLLALYASGALDPQ